MEYIEDSYERDCIIARIEQLESDINALNDEIAMLDTACHGYEKIIAAYKEEQEMLRDIYSEHQ